ncbi:type II toxin-antitoxin system VapC family toxin [Kaistia nematophila]|uniref:Type II toxin-antitoxin system VapC family toxin n=1 Tax=Kaistia nematophila TaxID=2994654 RepID=A0A9X3IMF6_9HYPH|nr:type II toxin-antitoxin system VapC family toxin [Kaistia nematophila]MBN9026958.1 type II toxin-antitoxin system VapC family toxin [Hyphomicrobiales bacterium]MCX5570857.1 type II toxin-antitoxin system VapC family toxin [Kaistia nematophila]
MRLLLDTQVWFWWMMGSPRLAPAARAAIADAGNDPLISAASVLELMGKRRIGILPAMQRLADHVEEEIDLAGFGRLPITTAHAVRAETIAEGHPDPFDRLLIAQALIEDIALISNDTSFDRFGVRRLWERAISPA